MERISSRANAKYKSFLTISHPRRSSPDGLVFLEGSRLCQDALESGAAVEAALVADGAGTAVGPLVDRLSGQVPLYGMPDHLFAGLCDTEHPQGFALICRSPVLEKPAGPPDRQGLYLIAEGLQDPGNLGTLIRTADAFAFNGVIVTEGTVWPMNAKVLRAAMGSCFHIPLLMMPDIPAVAAWLDAAGIPLLAADARGREMERTGWPPSAALVIGNEAHGLSEAARAACRMLVRIPMPGKAESLNAAAAASILSYELMLARISLK